MATVLSHIEQRPGYAEPQNQILTEETQWVALAQKNLSHFEPLYKKYYQAIYEYVYRRCDDAEYCLDITSMVFEKAMLNIGKFRFQGYPFGSWLYRIAASEIGNYYRNKNKERKVWVRNEGLADLAEEIEQPHNNEENLHLLLNAFQQIEPAEMELIVMRYFEKRSFLEISGIIDCTESNARVRVHRVLQKIKKIFLKEDKNG